MLNKDQFMGIFYFCLNFTMLLLKWWWRWQHWHCPDFFFNYHKFYKFRETTSAELGLAQWASGWLHLPSQLAVDLPSRLMVFVCSLTTNLRQWGMCITCAVLPMHAKEDKSMLKNTKRKTAFSCTPHWFSRRSGQSMAVDLCYRTAPHFRLSLSVSLWTGRNASTPTL